MASKSGGNKPSYLKNKDLYVDDESTDEGLSDSDDLLTDFNATSLDNASKNDKVSSFPKPMARNTKFDSTAGFSSNPLMMTMKTPMHPTNKKRPVSPPSRNPLNKLSSLGEQEHSDDLYSDDEFRSASNKPSFLKSQQSKSSSQQGRDMSTAPKPQPRQQSMLTKSPTFSKSNQRQNLHDSIDGDILDNSPRKTPTDFRKTPVDHRKSPHDLFSVDKNDARTADTSLAAGRRKSPLDEESPNRIFSDDRRRKSVTDDHGNRDTPIDRRQKPSNNGRKSPLDHRSSLFEERRTPVDHHRRSPGAASDELDAIRAQKEKRYVNDRKSPFSDEKSRQKSPSGGDKSRHRSPGAGRDENNRQQSPFPDSRKTPPLESNRRSPYNSEFQSNSKDQKSSKSVLDLLTQTSGKQFDEDDNEPSRHKSSKTPFNEPTNPFERVAQSPKPRKSPLPSKSDMRKSRGNQNSKQEQSDSDDVSSVCEELVEEPVKPNKSETTSDAVVDNRTKTQRSDHKKADDAIEMVKGTQSGAKMRFIEPAEENKSEKKPQSRRSSAAKVVKPQPRYAKAESAKAETSQNFDSTDAIRDAVFREWKAKRLEGAKQQLLEKQRKEKEIEEKKKQEKSEKDEYAKKAYEAWKNDKKNFVSEKTLQKRREEEKARKEEEEKKRKKDEAEITFRQWKASVDEQLRKKHQKSLKETNKGKVAKEDDAERKKKEAQSAYETWKRQKDEVIAKSVEKQTEEEKKKKEEEKKAAAEEAEQAKIAYERWLEQKVLGGQL